MFKRILIAAAMAAGCTAATVAWTQDAPTPPIIPVQQTKPAPVLQGEQVTPPPAMRLDTPGQPVNIKLEITITDQTGPGDPLRKLVTLIVADRGTGSIRSTGSVRSQGRVQINVDARPSILASGAVRLGLGLEYNPRTLGSDAPTEWSSLNEQIGVLLEPGKPLVVSQAADPASDRKITVELKATILR